MADFVIAHMYPDLMNLYGDRGNLLCLKKRLEWYGHSCRLQEIARNSSIDFKAFDMVFIGGGSDREQNLVYLDLMQKADQLMQEIESGLPVLCICGAYQLLGTSYRASNGEIMHGLGFFNFHTLGAEDRLIGNILINSKVTGQELEVVGFENHAGRTYFQDSTLNSFGTVIKGYGNNGEDKSEGISYRNLIGTYIHGPLLPKNPAIADYFIRAMGERQGVEIKASLDDTLENLAHKQAKGRLLV